MSKLSERLKSLIKERNLSLLAFEKEVGISNAQLGKYIKGFYDPSLENAIIIANHLGCSLDFLCGIDVIYNRFKILKNKNIDLFLERYETLIKEKGTNYKRISIDLNFSRNGSLRWRKNKIFPVLSILIKLSGYFNVPIEYLIGRIDEFNEDY